MTCWPNPTRADHDKFCRTEGWRRVRDARGRTGTHHVTYEFDLPDGRTLRTRVSHPPNRTDYGPGIWAHILRDQLDVSESDFWDCVTGGVLPARGGPAIPKEALPAELVHLLRSKVGIAEAEIAAMTKDEAVARLTVYWTTGT